jgi:hypothetical protein
MPNTQLLQTRPEGGIRGWAKAVMPRSMKACLRRTLERIQQPSKMDRLIAQTGQLNDLLARLMYEGAFRSPRFQEESRLLRHGFKVFSQHDEDGILEEIFRRIGTTQRFFVEFGAGDGTENTTLYCLAKGWSGAWIDGSAACCDSIERRLAAFIASGRLRMLYSFITAENIEALFERLGVPLEPDLLVIDIDRNDYWVWRAIRKSRPRVVCIEYNASLKQTLSCVVPYDAGLIGAGDNYYGASLKALENLGYEKGYRLVGCNYTGVDSFFVREDLVKDSFAEPFTSENHYEPPRYFCRMPNGHAPAFGTMVEVQSLPRSMAAG